MGDHELFITPMNIGETHVIITARHADKEPNHHHMHSKVIEERKKLLFLTQEQRHILIGTLLGDAHLETRSNGKTYRLKIEHSIKQQCYTEWLYRIFHDWVLTGPRQKEKRIGNARYVNYGFTTVSHSAFRFYAHQFYDQRTGTKKVPKLIHRWLSPQAIAVWFMDDGSIKSQFHKARIINTQCFTRKEVGHLRDVMRMKYDIQSSLRKQKEGYQLMILAESAERFAMIVRPYMQPSMMYKLKGLG